MNHSTRTVSILYHRVRIESLRRGRRGYWKQTGTTQSKAVSSELRLLITSVGLNKTTSTLKIRLVINATHCQPRFVVLHMIIMYFGYIRNVISTIIIVPLSACLAWEIKYIRCAGSRMLYKSIVLSTWIHLLLAKTLLAGNEAFSIIVNLLIISLTHFYSS